MQPTSLTLYMQAQRELYMAGLPEKVQALEAALQRLESAAGVAGVSALAIAHKLAGSGGTFGFPEVSEAGASIEKALAGPSAGRALDAAGRQSLERGLQALKNAVASATAGVSNAPADRSASTRGEKAHRRTKPARLVAIVETDQEVAAELADQLTRLGYQSVVLAAPLTPVHAWAGRPVAVLANIDFAADPALGALCDTSAAGVLEATKIPLIFISGGADFQARLDAVRAGAVGYFPHPLDSPSLAALLDRLSSGEPSQPYRVLIVEDDEPLANFFASVLQSAGMLTCIVTDPSRIMAPLVEFRPDLITCDIHMPECSGIELAALIRQQSEFVRIPIVFLSTETRLDQQAQALKQGGDDFIIKPVAPAVLIAAAESRARRYRSLLAAEDTLRISEERFRLMFETSLDGFVHCLADGTIISANHAACKMLRMSEQQIMAAGVVGLLDPADPRTAGILAEARRTGQFRGELRCVRGDGTRFPAEVSSSRHTKSNGEVEASVIFRDITERMLAEQQIMQLHAGLELRVEQRTAELTAANQELLAFSHSLAHDLRQPYIAIHGLASLLEREVAGHLTDRGKHYLDRIRAGISQMNERTDSLLALVQLSRSPVKRVPLDLGVLATEVFASLKQHEPERSVHLSVPPNLIAQADAVLISHLLTVLLGNAWKFSSRLANAHISLGADMVGGEKVFFVRDDGDGFDMAYAGNLFEPFQRLHAPGEFAGAGIGLATARRIVTRHGGRIWATAAPGDGACFYFTLEPTAPRAGTTAA